ncbi:hypothetical protein M3231_01890 [Neobacillus mesonae]|nr:hypothetical protein [Neobacillus mesonae]
MKIIIYLVLCSFLLLTGCGMGASTESGLTGSDPPKADIQVRDKLYETVLGTHCWSSGNVSRCEDYAGPVEMLENEEPLTVSPGEDITFVMDYEPEPSQFSVQQYTKDGKRTEVIIQNHTFQAPTEKGVYYYSYGVWWMDPEEENISHGDAFYNFVIEVS